jgi:phosphopantothenoylcysteine synthetase/decarboxylase
LNDLIDERFIVHQYRTINSMHIRELKNNVTIYTRAVEAFLRIRKKQGLRHRSAFAKEIGNLQIEATQVLISSMNNLTDTIRAHLGMQALFLKGAQRSHDRPTRKLLSRPSLDRHDDSDETKGSGEEDDEESFDSNDDDDEEEEKEKKTPSRARKRVRV